MDNSRKNFILGILTGIFLCVAVAAVWFYLPSARSQKSPRELSVDQAIALINNEDFKEAHFKQSQVEFTDAGGAEWKISVSDSSREMLLKTVNNFNSRNPGAVIKITESFDSTGYGWVIVIQFLPLIFLGLFAIATASLAILAYKAVFKNGGQVDIGFLNGKDAGF
jgi:ATP-dependent Zn protease